MNLDNSICLNLSYFSLLEIAFMNRKNQVFSDEDRFIILSAIAGENIGYTTLFNYLKNNWFELKKRQEFS